MNKTFVTGVAAAALLAMGAYQSVASSRAAGTSPAAADVAAAGTSKPGIGRPAPAFALQAMDGRAYAVGGKRDKPLVLNFWASWCGPCHDEAPVLTSLQAQYGDKIDFYAVNVTKGDGMGGVRGFVKQYGISFPILLDTDGKAAELYRLRVVPSTFLIDTNGQIREVVHVVGREEWETKLNKLLSE